MATLSHVVFRIKHDCPVAQLSAKMPEIAIQSWTSHRLEVIHAHVQGPQRDQFLALLTERHPQNFALPTSTGVIAVFEPHFPEASSISRQLESHHSLWLQPLRYEAGWEYYDVVSLDNEALQQYLRQLMSKFPLQITAQGPVGDRSLLGSFFRPLTPVLEALTDKQLEAVEAAWNHGYYETPRRTTTEDVAKSLTISRSAFEGRLRGAENAVIDGLMRMLGAPSGRKPPLRRAP